MTNVALYVPEKEVSAWVTETDPKEARAWLASLPLADAGESARDIYQALYTLNRLALAPHTRLELMELYREPVSTVSSVLHTQFGGLAMPLPSQMRQMAEFIRQLQLEMAIGYKCAIQELGAARISWRKKNQLVLASERAMEYLGQVLLRSYQVYMPQPAGVWTEIHTLFRYAEEQGHLAQPVETADGAGTTTILRRYQQILLLGLCSPYQLPQNECNHVNAFLEEWADKAVIGDQLNVNDPAGHFLINLALDAPPVPMAQHRGAVKSAADLRVLNTLEVARTVHGLSKRLEDGESAKTLSFSDELSDASVREMLRRMIKFWGLTPQRKFARTQTRGHLSVCTGINALHFFGSGGKPFAPLMDPATEESRASARKQVQAGKSPDDAKAKPAQTPAATPSPGLPKWLAETKVPAPESFPVDRWRLQDESARGLLLLREGEMVGQLRVGDVLGMQSASNPGNWHAGVIRWIKSPQPRRVEMGVERLAPKVTPVALRLSASVGGSTPYAQGLLLPAMPVLQRPAALLAPRGLYQAGRTLELVVGNNPSRTVRPLKLLERTATFDLIVFVDTHSPDWTS
jgi:hypothetical protein